MGIHVHVCPPHPKCSCPWAIMLSLDNAAGATILARTSHGGICWPGETAKLQAMMRRLVRLRYPPDSYLHVSMKIDQLRATHIIVGMDASLNKRKNDQLRQAAQQQWCRTSCIRLTGLTPYDRYIS